MSCKNRAHEMILTGRPKFFNIYEIIILHMPDVLGRY
jgi:hypothetical protein